MSNHGVLNLLKPPGMTSHDAVAHVRRVLKTKRVGHTGTLDPAAAGVLPICVGQATRLVETLQEGTKEYYAEATFGYETDTLDAVGQTLRECDTSEIRFEQVEAVCKTLLGSIEQEPPMHSAIKIGGLKLYDIARTGGHIEVPRRAVTISQLEIVRFSEGERPRAFLKVECSGGTYIRSLVRDIGRALGNAATMTFLTRTRSGLFSLADTLTPEEFADEPMIQPISRVLENLYGTAHIDDGIMKALWQGKHVTIGRLDPQILKPCLISNQTGDLWSLATYNRSSESWKPEKVFDLRQS